MLGSGNGVGVGVSMKTTGLIYSLIIKKTQILASKYNSDAERRLYCQSSLSDEFRFNFEKWPRF